MAPKTNRQFRLPGRPLVPRSFTIRWIIWKTSLTAWEVRRCHLLHLKISSGDINGTLSWWTLAYSSQVKVTPNNIVRLRFGCRQSWCQLFIFFWHIQNVYISCPCGNCTSKTSEAFLSGRATSKVTTFTSPSAKAAWHSSPLRNSKVAVDATCTAQGMAGTTWYCAASPRSRDVQMWWRTSVWSCLRFHLDTIFGYKVKPRKSTWVSEY